MKNLLFVLSVLFAINGFGQTVADDAIPEMGYRSFRDSSELRKPLLWTQFRTGSTLKFLMRDTSNNTLGNWVTPAELTTSLGSSFIFNQTSQQSSANFNIDGSGTIATNLRVNGQLAINMAPSGTPGFNMTSKNFYMQGAVSDNSQIIHDIRAANGGQRFSFLGGGLAMFGYTTAPTQQSATTFYNYRTFIGNDDGGYLHLSRYNAGTPYGIIQISESASTGGTAGLQLITSESGAQRIAVQFEAGGQPRFLKEIRVPEVATPTTPASGNGLYYFKSDNLPYALNDAGVEMPLYNTLPAAGTIWSGQIGGTTTATGDATISSGDNGVQYTSANTAPATFTLPTLASNLNRVYLMKNEGTDVLTVQRAGSDQLYTNAAVNSITIPVGESRIIASGGSSFWHVYGITSWGGSATLDFPSTLANTSSDLTITLTGAADGDVVSLGVPNVSANANSVYTAWVSAANTVTVRFSNIQAVTAIDPASGTFKVRVIK